MTPNPRNSMDDLATIAGLEALDRLTDEWWLECSVDSAVAHIASMVQGPFKERAFDSIVAIIKQSHTEGLYRGFEAGRDFTPPKEKA